MKNDFYDIFESLNSMHRKYRAGDYLENLESFKNNSNDLVQIMEKYKVTKEKNKINITKDNKKK